MNTEIKVVKSDGSKVNIDLDKIHRMVEKACRGITGVSESSVEMNSGLQFKITKNRITKLALEKTRCKDLSKFFIGPTAVALSSDAITSAKILTNFSKDNSNLKILGGIMGNDILDVAGVKNVATLPSLDEARAKIVGLLRSPAQKIASILLAPASKIAILALEKSKK